MRLVFRDCLGTTDMRTSLGKFSMTRLAWVALTGGGVLAVMLLMSRGAQNPGTGHVVGRSDGNPARRATFQENISKPIERPVIRPAKDAGIAPEELVIGVIVDGKARAYRLNAMEGLSQHLVNDVIGEIPVSVAYCNRNECARAYVGKPGTDPLGLRVTGLLDGAMVLESGVMYFFQESGDLVDPAVLGSSLNPIASAHARKAAEAAASRRATSELPFTSLKPAIMTWKSWLARHPGTDIYAGS